MIYILIAGFGALVLGLNLMMIWSMLTITTAATKEPLVRLRLRGVVVTIIGLVVITVGWYRLCVLPAEGSVMLMAGSAVAVLGLGWLVRVIGRGREKCVRDGAWFAAGIGAGLILAYGVVVYVIGCGS